MKGVSGLFGGLFLFFVCLFVFCAYWNFVFAFLLLLLCYLFLKYLKGATLRVSREGALKEL